jgi:hypothetical protein
VTLDVKGHGATLDGHNQRQGLFVYSGQVTFEDLNVVNTIANGGTGVGSGGGGAGLGGGLFVASGGNVVLSNVNFNHTAAVGGDTAFIRTPGHGIPGNTSAGRDATGGGGGLFGGTGGHPQVTTSISPTATSTTLAPPVAAVAAASASAVAVRSIVARPVSFPMHPVGRQERALRRGAAVPTAVVAAAAPVSSAIPLRPGSQVVAVELVPAIRPTAIKT